MVSIALLKLRNPAFCLGNVFHNGEDIAKGAREPVELPQQGHPPFEGGQEVDPVCADPNGRRKLSRERSARILRISFANAGIAGSNYKSWECPIDAWKQVIDINLTGVFLCCSAIVPYMLEQDYGRIVNVASIAGKEGNANASAYSASKAGVIAFTKSLGKETANKNISVNCITPAAAPTRIFDQMS